MCTSIYQVAIDGTHVLSRTMDWPSLQVEPIFLPRKYEWYSVFDHRAYQNKYAFIGGGKITSERADISDGVNEFGLCAQKLTFANGANFDSERDTTKVQLAAFEFIFWVLGNFQSVAELESQIDTVQLMADTNSVTKYGNPELHFSLMDSTGRIIVIEPSHSPLKIRENPLGIVTNAPKFDRQIERLEKYVTFTSDFKYGTVALDTPKVTTGNLSGKSIPPGSYSPGARFIRAAYFKERADQAKDENDAIVSSWHLLDSVSVPKNRTHQNTYSVYRAATVAETKSYYFQPYHREGIIKLNLTEAMLSWTEPKVYPVADELNVQNLN